MFIPFDILVFALGACLKERLSNSFYKSSSLCCRRTNTQLLHIYILVPALGGAWKVEQPLEALPSSLHPVHWFFTFLLSSCTQKIELFLSLSTGNLTAVGKLEEPEERTFTLCGAPHYRAPEILLGQGYSFPVDW